MGRQKPRWKGIGGTDAAALLGLNPYSSPFDVWYTKVTRSDGGIAENKYITWGKLQEPIVANYYKKITGHYAKTSPRLWHPDREWQAGTPDRIVWENREAYEAGEEPIKGWEGKTGLAKHGPKWGPSGHTVKDYSDALMYIPVHYWVQTQWYTDITKLPLWDLSVKLDSCDYRQYAVWPDQDFLDDAIPRCEEFWTRYVLGNRPPPVDHGEKCRIFLQEFFPEHNEEFLEAEKIDSLDKCLDLWKERKAEAVSLKENMEEQYRLQRKEREIRKKLNVLSDALNAQKNSVRMLINSKKGIRSKKGEATWTKSGKSRVLRFKFTT